MADKSKYQIIPIKRGFSSKDAAAYIGVSESYLRKDRMNGKRDGYFPGPRWHRVGSRTILYFREDLDGWMDALPVERLSIVSK